MFKLTPEADEKFGDYYLDIYKSSTRWVRVSKKLLDSEKSYVFLKLFKSVDGINYERRQYVTLTGAEWDLMMKATVLVERSTPNPGSSVVGYVRDATPEQDALFGEYYIDILKDENRWVRVTGKVFETTGQYIYIKLFKANNGIFQMKQVTSLTLIEWFALIDRAYTLGQNPVQNYEKVPTENHEQIQTVDIYTPQPDAPEPPQKKRRIARKPTIKHKPNSDPEKEIRENNAFLFDLGL